MGDSGSAMPFLSIGVRWGRLIGWVCKPKVTGSIPVRSITANPLLMRVCAFGLVRTLGLGRQNVRLSCSGSPGSTPPSRAPGARRCGRSSRPTYPSRVRARTSRAALAKLAPRSRMYAASSTGDAARSLPPRAPVPLARAPGVEADVAALRSREEDRGSSRGGSSSSARSYLVVNGTRLRERTVSLYRPPSPRRCHSFRFPKVLAKWAVARFLSAGSPGRSQSSSCPRGLVVMAPVVLETSSGRSRDQSS
jgi:hypothetical protein